MTSTLSLLMQSLIGSAMLYSPSTQAAHHHLCAVEDANGDLESQYVRLMNLPAHLQSESLKSDTVSWSEEQEVWLCPDQRSPSDRRRIDYFTGMDCGEIELLFSLYRADEMPTNEKIGFDYQSWCKCPGATVSHQEQSCELCPDNEEEMHENRLGSIFSVARGGKSMVLSCSQAVDYALYFTNEERCREGLKEAQSFCCEPLSSVNKRENNMRFVSLTLQDFQITLVLIVCVSVISTMVVFAALYVMGGIDKYWLSWEDL